jgi:hypothetical protein
MDEMEFTEAESQMNDMLSEYYMANGCEAHEEEDSNDEED